MDTNVLIVASAADAGSPFRAEGTPVDDAALRQRVFDWLEAFEADPARHAVLDAGWQVCGEYGHKLSEQDYGWLVMMHKIDRNEVVWVDVQPDADGNAVLPPDLASAVTDLADRKMVAAALAALGVVEGAPRYREHRLAVGGDVEPRVAAISRQRAAGEGRSQRRREAAGGGA